MEDVIDDDDDRLCIGDMDWSLIQIYRRYFTWIKITEVTKVIKNQIRLQNRSTLKLKLKFEIKFSKISRFLIFDDYRQNRNKFEGWFVILGFPTSRSQWIKSHHYFLIIFRHFRSSAVVVLSECCLSSKSCNYS